MSESIIVGESEAGHEIANAITERLGFKTGESTALWNLVRNLIAERNNVNQRLADAKIFVQTLEAKM